MSNAVTLELSLPIAAPVETVWDALTEWPRQGEWMLGTRVWVSAGDGTSVGSELSAFTGVGRLGFLDTMTISEWLPPDRCAVVHTGRVVRGTGWMGVRAGAAGGSEFVWGETLQLPLGPLGRAGWVLVGPLMKWGVLASLRRFARLVEAR